MTRSRYNNPEDGDAADDAADDFDDDYYDSEAGTDHMAADDDFDYEEYAQREFGDHYDFGDPNRPQATFWQGSIKLIVWLLITAMILGLLAPLIF